MKDLQVSALLVLALAVCANPVAQARGDLASPDPGVRAAAAGVLGESKDKESVPQLMGLLDDTDAGVRKQAARALGNIGSREAAQPLVERYVREEHGDVMLSISRALVKIGSPSVQPLIGALRAGRSEVRSGAARALGRIGPQRAVDPLIGLLNDRVPEVRQAAVHALRTIGGGKALEAIARSVQDRNGDVESSAENALGGRGYEAELDRAKRLIRGAVR